MIKAILVDNNIYTTKEAMALLGVSEATIKAWCASGKLEAEKAGGIWLIRIEAKL